MSVEEESKKSDRERRTGGLWLDVVLSQRSLKEIGTSEGSIRVGQSTEIHWDIRLLREKILR